jgi:hypothetical protein
MDTDALDEIADGLQAAADAALGDSNDTELEVLWDVVHLMAAALGMAVPEGNE